MPRTPRLDPIDGWHHVMNRGVNRAPIFTNDADRITFGRLLGEIADRHGVETHAYCLMRTHFHLLVRCPNGGLSSAMHLLQSSFARIVNDRTGRVGHLFGDRFCSRLVTDVVYLANVVRYIHQNPTDIAEVTDIGVYRWSSHRTYLGFRSRPPWLHLETVLGWFDDDTGAFDRFVRSTSQPSGPLAPAASELLHTVDLLLAELSDAYSRHLPAQRRAVLLTLLPHLRADRQTEIVHALDITSAGALRTANSRARTLGRIEPTIAETVDRARQLVADDLRPRAVLPDIA